MKLRDVPPINKTALSHITDEDFNDLNDFVIAQCYQFEANMKNFHYISVKNAEYMWDIDNREDGDHGFVWNFTYSNQLPNYEQNQLEGILNKIGRVKHMSRYDFQIVIYTGCTLKVAYFVQQKRVT